MKKAITIFTILAMISGLCAGCKKEADPSPKPETTQQTQESDAKDWEPETAEQPADHDHSHDDHDHSDHDH